MKKINEKEMIKREKEKKKIKREKIKAKKDIKIAKKAAIRAIKKSKKDTILAWKLLVKERDNWTCQICRKELKDNPKNCHAHHILDKKNFKEFALDPKNGITLCYRCHKVGPKSPHLNALYFANWLKENKLDIYIYLKMQIFNL